MKKAYVRIRLLYRNWINTKKPTTTEYILLVAVASAIVIKIRTQIEAKMNDKGPMKVDYARYYDDVSKKHLFD